MFFNQSTRSSNFSGFYVKVGFPFGITWELTPRHRYTLFGVTVLLSSRDRGLQQMLVVKYSLEALRPLE